MSTERCVFVWTQTCNRKLTYWSKGTSGFDSNSFGRSLLLAFFLLSAHWSCCFHIARAITIASSEKWCAHRIKLNEPKQEKKKKHTIQYQIEMWHTFLEGISPFCLKIKCGKSGNKRHRQSNKKKSHRNRNTTIWVTCVLRTDLKHICW